ncbi:MAG: hypothetical protein RSB86_16630 [Comamonas sp.]|uniref:hypothetical protein n=1 Tax=Comamonas sp. TaxID=34028 RepID=UPI002FC5A8C4
MKNNSAYLPNLIPFIVGGMAAVWSDLSTWIDMKEGLIAFLGFLAASLVQIMPITANFLQSDKLLLPDATRLTNSLKQQQYYWIGLLAATIFTLIILILSTVLVKKVKYLGFPFGWNYDVEVSAFIVFVLVSSLSFVLLKMLGLFKGVLSLHDLRTEIILANAKKRSLEEAQLIPENTNGSIPADYGKIGKSPEGF